MDRLKEDVYGSLLGQLIGYFRSRDTLDPEDLAAKLMCRLCRTSAVRFVMVQQEWILRRNRIPKKILQEARRMVGQSFEKIAVEKQRFQRFAESNFREYSADDGSFGIDQAILLEDDRHRLALKLRCAGFREIEIASQIGVTTRTLRNWKKQWREDLEF